jgi:hypothetical protein
MDLSWAIFAQVKAKEINKYYSGTVANGNLILAKKLLDCQGVINVRLMELLQMAVKLEQAALLSDILCGEGMQLFPSKPIRLYHLAGTRITLESALSSVGVVEGKVQTSMLNDALNRQSYGVVAVLMQHERTYEERYLLDLVAPKDVNLVDIMIIYGAPFDADSIKHSFAHLINRNDLWTARMLVARGLKPTALDLYNAACAGNEAMVELFRKTGLKRGTNPLSLSLSPPSLLLDELTCNCRRAGHNASACNTTYGGSAAHVR